MDYVAFVYVMLATVFYAVFYFLTYKISDVNNIDWSLMLSTLFFGVIFGVVQALTGILPTFEGVGAQIAEYWVIIAVLDQIVHQILYRYAPEFRQQSEGIRKGLQDKTGKGSA